MLAMNSSPEPNCSKLSSNLRHFRFQKKPLPQLSHNNPKCAGLPDCTVVVPDIVKNEPKEVVIDLVDSDDETAVKIATPLSTVAKARIPSVTILPNKAAVAMQGAAAVEKRPTLAEDDPPFNEEGFLGLKQFFRSIDPKIIENCLIRAKGDCVKAKQYIREEAYGYPKAMPINYINNVQKVTPPTTTTTTIKTSLPVTAIKSPTLAPFPQPIVVKSPMSINSQRFEVKSSVSTTASSPQQFGNKSPLSVSVNRKFKAFRSPTVASSPPEQPKPVKKRSLCGTTNGSQDKKYKRIKRIRRDSEFNSGDESDGMDEGGFSNDHRVFDSDEDSDVEVSNVTSGEQKQVLEFLSNATLSELLCMPQISKKKAEAIIEQRPFDGWRDMVEKFQQGKSLGTEVLNSANQFLYTRHVVTQLMKKCSKLSAQLEQDNFAGNMALKSQPSLVNAEMQLAGYQMIGLNWLVMLRERSLNGILADEMGLGKTVQVIAFLAWLKETVDPERRKPHLIVVPSSTLENWSNEIALWCPSLQVSVYYGTQDERRAIRIEYSGGGVREHDVVLTTYNLLTASPAERKMFRVLEFDYVIFDEAHMLKNMNTIRYEHLSHINAKRRILLTGTPLQNNLLELMSLLTFVMPDLFYNKKEYLKCLFTRNANKERKLEEQESLPRFEQEQVIQAKKIMKPFVLRRLKKDVLKDLPAKIDHLRSCDMSERQRNMYDNLIRTFSRSTTEKVDDDASGKTMSMMMQLRRVSNHPLLIRDQYTEYHIERMAQILVKEPNYQQKNLEYAMEDLSILSDFELHSLCEAYKSLEEFALSDDYVLDSGKFKVLDQLMEEFEAGEHRVLIFSQFVIMLNVLQRYMELRGYKHLRLDGSTPVPIRQELIDQFNQDCSIKAFLLSTRAGGLGINLTAADTVIIHDMDFNPYNDKQAEDRCHRVGQTKSVTVYRFVSKNSIEEDIHHIASEKLHLEKEISAEDVTEDRMETKWVLKKALGLETNPLPPINS